MNRSVRILAAVAGMTFLLSGTGIAGWEIHEVHSSPSSPDSKQVTYLEKDRVRIEMEDGAQVMDFRTRKILWIDNKEKTYSVMTFDEFKQMIRENKRAASKAMEEMKRRGFSMPPMGSRPKPKIKVRTLPGATIAGYASDGYQILTDGEVTEEVWTTKKIDLSREFNPANYREFEEFSREAARMMPGSEEENPNPALQKVYESGYVMKTVYKQMGDVEQVTRAERKSLPGSLFTEPNWYKKVPPAMRGRSLREGMEEERGGLPPDRSDGEVAGKSAEEETKPAGEPEKGALDSIREGAKEGIKKLFKW